MSIVFKNIRYMRMFVLTLALVSLMGFMIPSSAQADDPVSFGMPSQDSCDHNMGSQSWGVEGLNIERPEITSMTVDGETVDPLDPVNESIGAVVCANTPGANRVGVSVFRRHDLPDELPGHEGQFIESYTAELDGAETPVDGDPITADSVITMTIDLGGDIGEDYSFSLVHGDVTNWVTSSLGTDSATVTVSFKPVRTPMGSGSSGNFDYSFCTATPPDCHAVQSQADYLSAGLDMQFNQEENADPTQFRGAYFALTGAMGGFVTAEGAGPDRHLVATLGAPHFRANGTTPNTGSMQAFLPDASVADLFGLDEEEVASADDSTFDIIREEAPAQGEEPVLDEDPIAFTATPVSGGLLIEVDEITFSSPIYTIGLAGSLGEGDGSGDGDGGGEGGETTVDLPENAEVVDNGGKAIAVGSDDNTVVVSNVSASVESTTHADAGYSFPAGLVSFTMTVPSGSTQRVTAIFETSLPASSFVLRKFNDVTNTYSTVPGAVITSGLVDGSPVIVAKYDLQDNGSLDLNNALGTIKDPVGLAVAVAANNTTAAGTLPTTGTSAFSFQVQVTTALLAAGFILLLIEKKSKRRLLK